MTEQEEILEQQSVTEDAVDTVIDDVELPSMEDSAESLEALPMVSMDEEEDPDMLSGVALPTFDDVNDSSIMKNTREVFRGFTFDSTEDFGKRFQDTNQLAQYMITCMKDIGMAKKAADGTQALKNGAAMVRFWCMATAMDKAITTGKYGTSACNKLAAYFKQSISYIYQIRSVATRLTLVDCYLLGIRGCNSTTLRKLSYYIKDDNIRKGIITAFITAYTNTANQAALSKAKKALVAAINMVSNPKVEKALTSDPLAGGAVLEVADSYQNLLKSLKVWQKLLKRASQDKDIEELCKAAGDFSLNSSVPNADNYMQTIKEEVGKTKAMLLATKNNIEDAVRELESVEAAEVIDVDDMEDTSEATNTAAGQ